METSVVKNYERFIGCKVEILSMSDEAGRDELDVDSGLLSSLSDKRFTLAVPLRIEAIRGIVTLEVEGDVHMEIVCEKGTVVNSLEEWSWVGVRKIVARLPREKLEIDDIITIRTNNGWRGESTVEVRVVDITACSPSGSTITVEPEGYDRECISITDETVEVNLYPGS
jgi:hypothetical protein